MNKEEIRIVPQLRFPEFLNDGSWNNLQLGKVADVSKLAGYEFTKHIVYENEGEIIALRGLNIKNNKLDLTDVKYIDNSELSKLKRSKLYIDDLMFTYIGTIGEVALIEENNKYYLAPNVSRIRVNKEKILPKFILHHFNTSEFKKIEIAKYISSSSQPALTMGNVRKFLISVPPKKEEQQKIAACLSSLDEVITAESEKLDLLHDHKKGLLQQLFPAEGETQPKFRFPEFKKDGDWEEKELKKLLKFQTGYPFSSKGFNDENKGIRLIKNRDLKADDRIVFFEGSFDNSYLVDDGDILVGMDGDFSPVKWNKGKALLNQRVGRIKTKNNTDDFFFYFLSIHLKIIEYNTPSTTVKHLSHSTVENLMIPIPPTKEEQQKIAACLSAADKLIAAQAQKIEALQEHKNGLLQQLFPTINELAV